MPSRIHIPETLTPDDVTYSATARCRACNAGLCYTEWYTVEEDPDGNKQTVDKPPEQYIRHGPDNKALRAWVCSRIVFDEDLGDEHVVMWRNALMPDPEVPDEYTAHDVLPFTFWKVKSENQPSAQGRTTRPQEEDNQEDQDG